MMSPFIYIIFNMATLPLNSFTRTAPPVHELRPTVSGNDTVPIRLFPANSSTRPTLRNTEATWQSNEEGISPTSIGIAQALRAIREKHKAFATALSLHQLPPQAVGAFIKKLNQIIEAHPITQIKELENEKEDILQNLRQSSFHTDSCCSIDMMDDEVDAKTMNDYHTIDEEIKQMSAHHGLNDSKTLRQYKQKHENLIRTQTHFTYIQQHGWFVNLFNQMDQLNNVHLNEDTLDHFLNLKAVKSKLLLAENTPLSITLEKLDHALATEIRLLNILIHGSIDIANLQKKYASLPKLTSLTPVQPAAQPICYGFDAPTAPMEIQTSAKPLARRVLRSSTLSQSFNTGMFTLYNADIPPETLAAFQQTWGHK